MFSKVSARREQPTLVHPADIEQDSIRRWFRVHARSPRFQGRVPGILPPHWRVRRTYRKVIYVAIAACVCNQIAFTLTMCLACTPIAKMWDLRLHSDLVPRPPGTGTLLPAQRDTPQHNDRELPREGEREWTCDWLR